MQLRSAIKAYGVPWGVPLLTHPLHRLFAVQKQTCGMVSKVYKFISQPRVPLAVETIWSRDIPFTDEEEICWDKVWENLQDTFKNPNYQLINFTFIYRMYLTPRKRHAMKIIPSPNCDLCTFNVPGSFLHLFWECPNVYAFRRHLCSTLSGMFEVTIPLSPTLLLLNDHSSLELSSEQRRILWAGLTAAKKMLALRWQPPVLAAVGQLISRHSYDGEICDQGAWSKYENPKSTGCSLQSDQGKSAALTCDYYFYHFPFSSSFYV